MNNYFKNADADLVAHPMQDDVPIAFSSDLIMNTQEDLSVGSRQWNVILNSKITVERLCTTGVILHLGGDYKYDFKLSLVDDNWLIDSILHVNIK